MNKVHRADALTDARDRLARAASDMPVLSTIAGRFEKDVPFRAQRIALCGHITEATAIQVRTLMALGADVAWCASSTSTTDDAVAALMHDDVALIVGERGMSEDALHAGATAVLAHWKDGPTILLDEGARLIRAVHRDKQDISNINIAAEKTPEGIEAIGALRLRIPVLMSDMSIGKRLVDNPHGTGQSILQTILTVTQGLLAGKTLLVCGYGRVGSGLAHKARGLGARVLVSETRPTRALMAALNGFEVLPIVKALPQSDIVITVTGQPEVIGAKTFAQLRDGALLVNGGHLPVEVDTAALAQSTVKEDHAPGLTKHTFADGRSVLLMAGGNIANLSVGTGNPNSVMDATFASQVLGLTHAMDLKLEPGLHPLPDTGEKAVARLIAESLGIDVSALDRPCEAAR